LWIEVVLCNNA
jgi:hypothetical protein